MRMPYLYLEVLRKNINSIMDKYVNEQISSVGVFFDDGMNDVSLQGIARMVFDTPKRFKWHTYFSNYAIEDDMNLRRDININFIHLRNDTRKCTITATKNGNIVDIKLDFDYHFDNEAMAVVHEALIDWCIKNDN